MSEIGEIPESILSSESPKVSERKQPLTSEEISSIRKDECIGGQKGRKYTIEDWTISTVFISPNMDIISDNKRKQLITLLRSKQEGESYKYESLIVNSLLKQLQIAKNFGLSDKSMWKDLKIEAEDKGTQLIDDQGYLHLLVLDEHVASLKKQGATDEQIITELTGHIFHESVHEAGGNMCEALFNGKDPSGEIVTVTSQIAYYLEEGYSGPTSYDLRSFKAGYNKIQNGESNSRDYDIATYVGVTLLFQSLKETYPELLLDTADKDPYILCQNIITKLSPVERQRLIPTLKRAIANSADDKVYKDVLDKARQEKPENNR